MFTEKEKTINSKYEFVIFNFSIYINEITIIIIVITNLYYSIIVTILYFFIFII